MRSTGILGLELVIATVLVSVTVFFGSRYVGETWAHFPYDYQEVTLLNSPKPGGYLETEVSVKRTMVCPNTFYREIYDGQGSRISQYEWSQGGKPIGAERYQISIPIPDEAKPGPDAAYCFAQSPKCNVLQNALPYWTPMKCYRFKIEEN